jgi:hypothetical protein
LTDELNRRGLGSLTIINGGCSVAC